MPSAKDVLNATHGKLVFDRRVRVLSDVLAAALPKDAKVLDVGTGDGSIAANIMKQRTDLAIEGVDVFQRPSTRIPVTVFDGAISHSATARSTASCSSTYCTTLTTPACSCARPRGLQTIASSSRIICWKACSRVRLCASWIGWEIEGTTSSCRTTICLARGGTESSAEPDFKSTLGGANSGSILIRLPGSSTGSCILWRG